MNQQDRKSAMLLGSFVADVFGLGAHWIYDLDKLEKQFGWYDKPQDPLAGSFHDGKQCGDYTHYGDQALLLHEHLQRHNGVYSTAVFRSEWRKYIHDYSGYMDRSCRESAAAFDRGESYGSHSEELGGAARLAPVLYWISDPDEALAATLDQSRLTHGSAESLLATALFSRTVLVALEGNNDIPNALYQAAESMRQSGQDMGRYDHYLAQARQMTGKSVSEIATGIGQSCAARHAVPVILTLLLTATEYREAIELNVNIGGDSATRGLILGAIFGAHQGLSAVPDEWLKTIRQMPTLTGD